MAAPFWLAVMGIATAWYVYMRRPQLADLAAQRLHVIYNILVQKYGFDDFNQFVFAGGSRALGRLLWRGGDVFFIDGLLVNGTAKTVGWISTKIRNLQTGYLYHYSFAMIIGLILLVGRFAFD